MKAIQDAINDGDHKRAEILLQEYVKTPGRYDDQPRSWMQRSENGKAIGRGCGERYREAS